MSLQITTINGFSLFIFANVPLISNFSPKDYLYFVKKKKKIHKIFDLTH